jgi:OmpA-OmpF porin, OOP family
VKRLSLVVTLLIAAPALAQQPWNIGKQVAGDAAIKALQKQVNKRLLEEGRKNQCSFKTDTAEFDKSCDQKLRNLTNALVDAKKKLNDAGVQNFKFEVSGHTDSTGNAAHNRELSGRRAAVIVRELVARGVSQGEIVSVGLGSERPLVKPDNTPVKRAKNRRYEIQVRL